MLNRSPLFIPYSGGEGEGLSWISKGINRLDIEKKKIIIIERYSNGISFYGMRNFYPLPPPLFNVLFSIM